MLRFIFYTDNVDFVISNNYLYFLSTLFFEPKT